MLNENLLSEHCKLLTNKEIDLLKLYVNEAYFFASIFSKNIHKKNMELYEIGSGIGLLARIFASRGHLITATEPDNAGFGSMNKLNLVIEKSFEADANKILSAISNNPKFYSLSAQDLSESLRSETRVFDFIYCANVVEHVNDLSNFFLSVVPLLGFDGSFRFICPNYAFPYEPHFGFVTFFSKKLTFKLQKKKILNSYIDDSLIFWQDLSWPNARKIRKTLNKLGYSFYFSKEATFEYIERSLNDDFFIKRKPKFIKIVRFVKPFLWLIIKIVPVSLMPVIDCSITKKL